MKKSGYEAPRAVRLSDTKTGSFKCANGPEGTLDVCASGYVVHPHNVCAAGSGVIE
jgi:hypothetical protein